MRWSDDALEAALGFAGGYPYFMQVIGDETWRAAGFPGPGTVLEVPQVEAAGEGFNQMRQTFFRARWKKATPAEARMLRAVAREMNRSAGLAGQGAQGRIASHLAQVQARAARQMARGTGLLATIGSTAPFVGLFGTVWGIMNSFIGISEAQTTNLAVVAPGIAEALLATAIGLVAAIPAVVIYNFFARAITGYRLRLNETAASVERLVSRDLDRAAAGIRV